MKINKETAVLYIKSDIDVLSEQLEEKEIFAYVHRVRAEIGLLLTLKVLLTNEAEALEDEMSKARALANARMAKGACPDLMGTQT